MRYRGGVRSRSVDSQDLPDLLLLRSCLAAVYLDLPRRSRFTLRANLRLVYLDLSQGLDSVNPVKKVILPLKIVADPVPRKTERKIKICKRYIIECIGFCGDGASLMLSNYVVPYQI